MVASYAGRWLYKRTTLMWRNRKGAQNGNADGLSHQAWEEPQPTADDQRHQPSEGGGVRDQCLTYTAGSSLETGRA